jgi:hypothetical protein
MDFANASCSIGIIGILQINDKDGIEMDWIERILWVHQDYESLYNGEISNLLPPTRSLDLAIDIQAAKEPPL